MGFTNAGMTGGGQTTHYQITYDDTFPASGGLVLANGLMESCEADFALMTGWFGGINLKFSIPLPVQIWNASGGADWTDPSDFTVFFGSSPTVTIKPNGPIAGGTPTINLIRFLLVTEVTEMFMATQDSGWYEKTSLFASADEGSVGEGLSRFLGTQFLLANGLGGVPPPTYAVTYLWLNSSPRANYVDSSPDDAQPDAITGCTTCFIHFLHSQLNHSVNAIVAAGSSSVGGVYKNLTGQSDAWSSFINLVNAHYPPGSTYNPASDNIFPVPNLTQFYAPNTITCGYSDSTHIMIDQTALAEVNIQLTSDDPATVSVPATVTVPVGSVSAFVSIQTTAILGPFPVKSINVHATYAGKTLTIAVQVGPPQLASLTLAPDIITCGDTSVATLKLDEASLLGPVLVTLGSSTPGFATVPAPTITIPQDVSAITFTVSSPNILIAFKTAHPTIFATYAASYVQATLTVKSRVVAGILNTLVLSPTLVSGGSPSRGTVTLVEAVPVSTVVGLAAIEPSTLPGGRLPLPGNKSSVASVPSSITIAPGSTSGTFNVTTNDDLIPGSKRNVTVMAGAVVTLTETLVVEAS